MFRYILSSVLAVSFSIGCFAEEVVKTDDSRAFKGVFLDVDLAEPVVSVFSDCHSGANAALLFDINHKVLPGITVGYAKYDATGDYSSYQSQPDDYAYKVNGPYFKVGLDYNLIMSDDKSKPINPAGYVGARFAFSSYHFEVNDCAENSSIWGKSANITESGKTSAKWGEFVGGVRVPVYKRFFLGLEAQYKFSFKAKTKSFETKENNIVKINQTYAPGYGDYNDPHWGFRYYMSFFF